VRSTVVGREIEREREKEREREMDQEAALIFWEQC
jgi:hypothetical protein